jgi:hypothetical protein
MSDDELGDLPEVTEHLCPECGKPFKSAAGLGTHRLHTHGVESPRTKPDVDGAPKRRGRPKGSSRGSVRRERREQAVKETLLELAQFSDEMQGRGQAAAETLAEVIKRDAGKIAISLSWVGEKLTPVGFLIDRTMGHGGVITIARGFNGVIMHAVRSWRELLQRRAAEAEFEQLNETGSDAAADADAASDNG